MTELKERIAALEKKFTNLPPPPPSPLMPQPPTPPPPATPPPSKLTVKEGIASNSYPGRGPELLFDGTVSESKSWRSHTSTDGNIVGDWAGADLGVGRVVTKIRVCRAMNAPLPTAFQTWLLLFAKLLPSSRLPNFKRLPLAKPS